MAKIAKFVCVLIIMLSLFIFATNDDGEAFYPFQISLVTLYTTFISIL